MKTRALHVHVAAYSDRLWSVAILEETYDQGRKTDAELVKCTWVNIDELEQSVQLALRRVMDLELARIVRESTGGGPAQDPARAPLSVAG